MIKMKAIFLQIFLLLSIIICLEPNEEKDTNLKVFTNNEIRVPEGKPTVSGTTIIIEKPGFY